MLNYTFFDHSRKPDSYEIAVQGVFRYYHAVEDAIEKINRKHADWCGFGIKLKEDGIDEAWESTERDEFEKMFIEYNCYERKKKGFYAKPGEETEEEKRASTNTAIIVIIVLACFIGVAIVVLITLVLCKFCGKESENDVEAGLERSKKKRGGQATRSSKKSSRRSVLENTERTTSGSALKEDNKSGSEESSRL
ncbi:hypothetical protein L596_028861 [Steinernema carpocapsae]|uniref:Uncharacterized protein n=1 Tax=Steinernema carpocapsae TaxID=34508 RepID=A0A4U5LZR2_STECR|nr:hypothetical protein L596_028861 [Steinernema carpocapsae]